MTVPALESQPFVEAKAAMSPNDNEKQALQERIDGPKLGKFVEIGILDAKIDMRNARVDDMRE